MRRKNMGSQIVKKSIVCAMSAMIITNSAFGTGASLTVNAEGVEEGVQEVVETADVQEGIKEAKDAVEAATPAQVETAVTAVLTIGEGVISQEALAIINGANASADLDVADKAIEDGEAAVEDALDGDDENASFDEDIKAAVDANTSAAGNEKVAEDAKDVAEEALEEANKATSSAQAREDAAVADQAAKDAQEAADNAAVDSANAQKAYEDAVKAYEAAKAEAEAAQNAANAALEDASEDAAAAVENAKLASDRADALKAEMDAAAKEAAANVETKSEVLQDAEDALDVAKEALEAANDKKDEEQAKLDETLKATVETGAFLAAAEVYEGVSELAVDALELVIEGMEAAKELATEALAKAEEELANIEGDKEEAQAAYDAALVAYEAADAILTQAKVDLEEAQAEKDAADELVANNGDIIALEEALDAANTAEYASEEEKAAAVTEATDNLFAAVIQKNLSTEDKQIAEVKKVTDNTDGNVYFEATVGQGEDATTVYYKLDKGEDGVYSVYETNKTVIETNRDVASVQNVIGAAATEEAIATLVDAGKVEGVDFEVVRYDNGNAEIYELLVDEDSDSTFKQSDLEGNFDLSEEEKAALEAGKVVGDDTFAIVKVADAVEEVKAEEALYTVTYKVPEVVETTKICKASEATTTQLLKGTVTVNGVTYETTDYWGTPSYKVFVGTEPIYTYIPFLGNIKVGDRDVYEYVAITDDMQVTVPDYRLEYVDAQSSAETDVDLTAEELSDRKKAIVNDANEVIKDLNDFRALLGLAPASAITAQDLGISSVVSKEAVEAVAGQEAQYRYVKFGKHVEVSYNPADNVADGSYEDITDKWDTATSNFNTKTDEAADALTKYNEAEDKKEETADTLADATEKYDKAKEVYDFLEGAYNGYYANDTYVIEGGTIELPWGLGSIEVPDTEVEIPYSSQYDADMATLKLALLAAEENLEVAKAAVEEAQVNHTNAVNALQAQTAVYEQAVADVIIAAAEVGKNEVIVAGAKVDLKVANDAKALADAKYAYASDLAASAEVAEAAAVAAQEKVDALLGKADVSSEVLAKAVADLALAQQAATEAADAAAAAQEAATDALEAYNDILTRIVALVAAEAADDDDDDDDEIVVELPVVEAVPAPVAAATVVVAPVEPTVEEPVVEIEEADVPLAEEVVDTTDENKEDGAVSIDDNAVPMAAAPVDTVNGISWWWLLVIAVLGGSGVGLYYKSKAKKAQKADK